MDSECKCQYPNYTAFTGRCMTCGGFHKKDLDFSFDYKSRDWENSNSKPVCVACLNESRAHQIPGSYEHICGKQIDNTQQLPAEVVEKILRARDALVIGDRDEAYHQLYGIANPGYDSYFPWHDMERQISYPEFSESEIKNRRQVTEYATKLHQVEQEKEFYKRKLISEKEFFEDGYKDLQARHTTAITLLSKFISRHEAGLLPDRFIYEEIKTFLDGTK